MVRSCTLLLIAAAVCLAPGRAWADDPEPGLWWSPTLQFTSVVDDNVYSTNTNKSGDVGFWIAPRIEAGYSSEAVEIGLDVGVDVRQYIDERSASDELIRAIGFAEVGLAEGLNLRISNAYVPQGVLLGRPQDDTLTLVQSNRLDATLDWTRDLKKGRTLNIGVVGTHYYAQDFPEALPAAGGGFVIDPRFRGDYLQGLGFIELAAEIATRTRLWARTQVSYRDFTEFGGGADHTNVSFLVGIESERWHGFELEAAAGAGGLFFDSLGTGYRALVRARVLRRFDNGLSLWIGGRYLTSPDLTGGEVDESRGEFGFEQRFGSATSLSASGFVTHYNAPLVGGGSNLFGSAEVELRRQLTRRLQVGLVYRYWENGGTFGVDDYSQNRVGIEFGFRL